MTSRTLRGGFNALDGFLVLSLVPICRNLNTESIVVINWKLGTPERNLCPEKWYTVGTGVKEPRTGGTPLATRILYSVVSRRARRATL